ncbi:MAG: anti-sigma factor family protein [Alphaproteobacteria bacterium]
MSIPEDKLLAYADGLLPQDEAVALERELESDSNARELLDALKASDLPYREAAETLIDVPDLSGIQSVIDTYMPEPRAPFLVRYRAIAASIAVFFVVGLLAGRHVFPPEPPKPTQWAVWVDRIASYQALYSRATLSMRNPPPERLNSQMARVSKAIGVPLSAPDLTALDADFKYARMYDLEGAPLAQIAYLPKQGEPFSLCLMKTDKPDHAPKYSTAHGLNVATWRRGGIAYVYVGKTPKETMDRYIAAMQTQSGA